jgi:hypothetical protein
MEPDLEVVAVLCELLPQPTGILGLPLREPQCVAILADYVFAAARRGADPSL